MDGTWNFVVTGDQPGYGFTGTATLVSTPTPGNFQESGNATFTCTGATNSLSMKVGGDTGTNVVDLQFGATANSGAFNLTGTLGSPATKASGNISGNSYMACFAAGMSGTWTATKQ